jgi:4-aminobutyrate aminotransferase-like enzyme
MDSKTVREKHKKHLMKCVGNTVRISPALNIGPSEIGDALKILDESFASIGVG